MWAEKSPTKKELEKLHATLDKGLEALKLKGLPPRTPCPDSWTFALYVQDQVDEKIKQEINAHIAFCDQCYEEYAALVGPEKILEHIRAELNAGESSVVGARAEFDGASTRKLDADLFVYNQVKKEREFDAQLLKVLKRHAPEASKAQVKQLLSILRKVAEDLKYLPPTTISTDKVRETRQGLERELLAITDRNKELASALLETVKNFRPQTVVSRDAEKSASEPETRSKDRTDKSTKEH